MPVLKGFKVCLILNLTFWSPTYKYKKIEYINVLPKKEIYIYIDIYNALLNANIYFVLI